MGSSYKITPRVNVYFYAPSQKASSILLQTGEYLEAGHAYLFGEPAFMFCRRAQRAALPFLHAQGTRWALIEEMGLDIFEIQEIENLWNAKLARDKGEISINSHLFFAKLQRRAGAPMN